MNFTDKVEARMRLDTAGTKWDDGRRFVFDTYGPHALVGTEYADWADILWRSHTMTGQSAIVIIAWMDLGEKSEPSGRAVKDYYDTNELVQAFIWLAENTH